MTRVDRKWNFIRNGAKGFRECGRRFWKSVRSRMLLVYLSNHIPPRAGCIFPNHKQPFTTWAGAANHPFACALIRPRGHNISSNSWAWVSGSNIINSAGNYGTKGINSSTNLPRSRYFSSVVFDTVGGALFVFGGYQGTGSSISDHRISYFE